MISTDSIIAVTGASGFIGHSLCRRLIFDKVRVRALLRYRSDLPGEFQLDLCNDILDPDALEPPVRALVHCAWDNRMKNAAEMRRINVDGTRWLIDRCKKAGVEQFVFISPLTARADADSYYSRMKWEVEEMLLSQADSTTFCTILSAGLVIGDGGAFAKTKVALRGQRVLPVYRDSKEKTLQTIYIDDLCNAIISCIANRVTGRLYIAERNGVSISEFYRGILLLDDNRQKLITVPGGAALMLTRAMEAVGIKPKTTSEWLLNLRQMNHVEATEIDRLPGCEPFSDFWKSLQRLYAKNPEMLARILAATPSEHHDRNA